MNKGVFIVKLMKHCCRTHFPLSCGLFLGQQEAVLLSASVGCSITTRSSLCEITSQCKAHLPPWTLALSLYATTSQPCGGLHTHTTSPLTSQTEVAQRDSSDCDMSAGMLQEGPSSQLPVTEPMQWMGMEAIGTSRISSSH